MGDIAEVYIQETVPQVGTCNESNTIFLTNDTGEHWDYLELNDNESYQELRRSTDYNNWASKFRIKAAAPDGNCGWHAVLYGLSNILNNPEQTLNDFVNNHELELELELESDNPIKYNESFITEFRNKIRTKNGNYDWNTSGLYGSSPSWLNEIDLGHIGTEFNVCFMWFDKIAYGFVEELKIAGDNKELLLSIIKANPDLKDIFIQEAKKNGKIESIESIESIDKFIKELEPKEVIKYIRKLSYFYDSLKVKKDKKETDQDDKGECKQEKCEDYDCQSNVEESSEDLSNLPNYDNIEKLNFDSVSDSEKIQSTLYFIDECKKVVNITNTDHYKEEHFEKTIEKKEYIDGFIYEFLHLLYNKLCEKSNIELSEGTIVDKNGDVANKLLFNLEGVPFIGFTEYLSNNTLINQEYFEYLKLILEFNTDKSKFDKVSMNTYLSETFRGKRSVSKRTGSTKKLYQFTKINDKVKGKVKDKNKINLQLRELFIDLYNYYNNEKVVFENKDISLQDLFDPLNIDLFKNIVSIYFKYDDLWEKKKKELYPSSKTCSLKGKTLLQKFYYCQGDCTTSKFKNWPKMDSDHNKKIQLFTDFLENKVKIIDISNNFLFCCINIGQVSTWLKNYVNKTKKKENQAQKNIYAFDRPIVESSNDPQQQAQKIYKRFRDLNILDANGSINTEFNRFYGPGIGELTKESLLAAENQKKENDEDYRYKCYGTNIFVKLLRKNATFLGESNEWEHVLPCLQQSFICSIINSKLPIKDFLNIIYPDKNDIIEIIDKYILIAQNKMLLVSSGSFNQAKCSKSLFDTEVKNGVMKLSVNKKYSTSIFNNMVNGEDIRCVSTNPAKEWSLNNKKRTYTPVSFGDDGDKDKTNNLKKDVFNRCLKDYAEHFNNFFKSKMQFKKNGPVYTIGRVVVACSTLYTTYLMYCSNISYKIIKDYDEKYSIEGKRPDNIQEYENSMKCNSTFELCKDQKSYLDSVINDGVDEEQVPDKPSGGSLKDICKCDNSKIPGVTSTEMLSKIFNLNTLFHSDISSESKLIDLFDLYNENHCLNSKLDIGMNNYYCGSYNFYNLFDKYDSLGDEKPEAIYKEEIYFED